MALSGDDNPSDNHSHQHNCADAHNYCDHDGILRQTDGRLRLHGGIWWWRGTIALSIAAGYQSMHTTTYNKDKVNM